MMNLKPCRLSLAALTLLALASCGTSNQNTKGTALVTVGPGSWVTAAGAPCTNGPALVPSAQACEWQPCKDQPLPSVVYYVCNIGGNDGRSAAQARDPATPWATASRAQQQFPSLNAGEAVAFCRGGTFTGGGKWNNTHGTATAPTIVRDYTRPGRQGTGDPRPIFSDTLDNSIVPGNARFMNLVVHGSGDTSQSGVFTYTGVTGNIVVCNTEIANEGIGVHFGGDTTKSNIQVIGSRILNNYSQGWLGVGQGIVISHNYFYNNGWENTTLEHSIYVGGRSLQKDCVISDNEIHAPAHSAGVAIVMHGPHENVLFEDNRLYNDLSTPGAERTGYGIAVGCGGYEIPSNTLNMTMRGNMVVNPGSAGLYIGCCQHCTIENNLIVDTQRYTVGIAAPGEYAYNFGAGYTASSDVLVRNNTVYLTQGGSGITAGGEGTGYVVENNVVQSNSLCYSWVDGGFASRDYNASYLCSDPVIGAHSWKNNPHWVTPGSDFHPATGSPLIAAGDPSENPGIDIEGKSRPSTPSIGAYEP